MKLYLKLTVVILLFCVIIPVVFGLLLKDKPKDKTLILYIKEQDKCVELYETDYLTGVTAAEMPASFAFEALKAQAVAARTYYVRKSDKYKSDNPHNGGADVCSDFGHCQAYKDTQTLKKQWGNDFKSNYSKVRKAVTDTTGEVLKYKGEIIDAVFHSTSSGYTQNAVDVWGGNVEYLKSVESAVDKKSPRYNSKKTFSEEELKEILNIKNQNIEIGDITYNEGKTVDTVIISSKPFKGTQIREKLKLDSAYFEIECADNSVTFNVKGYGHGVGMSQWGANFLAQDGYTYDKILTKYYTGVDLSKIK